MTRPLYVVLIWLIASCSAPATGLTDDFPVEPASPEGRDAAPVVVTIDGARSPESQGPTGDFIWGAGVSTATGIQARFVLSKREFR